MQHKISDHDRLWARVIRRADSECWGWRGGRQPGGYGLVRFRGKQSQANRVMWTITRGEIPPGMLVCHACDNPPCTNPRHLFLGTQRDNLWDAARKQRAGRNARKLTVAQVRAIRKKFVPGLKSGQKDSGSAHALAREFGVCRRTIVAIVKRTHWAWLD